MYASMNGITVAVDKTISVTQVAREHHITLYLGTYSDSKMRKESMQELLFIKIPALQRPRRTECPLSCSHAPHHHHHL